MSSLQSLSSCQRRRRRTSSPGRVKEEEGRGEERTGGHPHPSSSTAIVAIRKHQKKTIIMATSCLILFASSLSSVLASSLPFAVKTFDYINHLHSKATTISGHIRHLEKHLWSISSTWSIANISKITCIDSSCWSISNNIKSIFNKMAAAGSSASTQAMDITFGDQQPQVEQVASSQEETSEQKVIAPLSSSITALKPVIGRIEDEKAAKIHIIGSIIYSTLSSDPAYNTPPSSSILRVYDSFGTSLRRASM